MVWEFLGAALQAETADAVARRTQTLNVYSLLYMIKRRAAHFSGIAP